MMIQLESLDLAFLLTYLFYPAKVGSIDKAKTSVTVVEKSTGLRGIKVQGFPIHGIKTERSIHMSLSLYDFKQKGFLSVKHRDSK